MLELIDTHAHLPSLLHKPLEAVLRDADEQGVKKIITVGAGDGLQSAFSCHELALRHQFIWATIGIHPHDAGEHKNLEQVASLAEHPKVVAIGETGLDFFRDWAPFPAQRILFEASISLAKELHLPLIIHCRDAMEETIETLKRLKAGEVGGVFHCYAGDAEDELKLRDLNFLVSFTGVLSFKKAEALRATAKAIPLERIMLETDCPYMAPEPFRGSPSEPMHVRTIAEKLASIKDISLEEVARVTKENAHRLFGI